MALLFLYGTPIMEICKVKTFMEYDTLCTQLQIYAKMQVTELRGYKNGDMSFDEVALKIGKEFLEQLALHMMKMDQADISFIAKELTY